MGRGDYINRRAFYAVNNRKYDVKTQKNPLVKRSKFPVFKTNFRIKDYLYTSYDKALIISILALVCLKKKGQQTKSLRSII